VADPLSIVSAIIGAIGSGIAIVFTALGRVFSFLVALIGAAPKPVRTIIFIVLAVGLIGLLMNLIFAYDVACVECVPQKMGVFGATVVKFSGIVLPFSGGNCDAVANVKTEGRSLADFPNSGDGVVEKGKVLLPFDVSASDAGAQGSVFGNICAPTGQVVESVARNCDFREFCEDTEFSAGTISYMVAPVISSSGVRSTEISQILVVLENRSYCGATTSGDPRGPIGSYTITDEYGVKFRLDGVYRSDKDFYSSSSNFIARIFARMNEKTPLGEKGSKMCGVGAPFVNSEECVPGVSACCNQFDTDGSAVTALTYTCTGSNSVKILLGGVDVFNAKVMLLVAVLGLGIWLFRWMIG
jgi:hypothetical protein